MRYRILDPAEGARTFAVVLDPGDEPVSSITDFARDERLAAAHFTAIGAFSRVTLGFFDLRAKDYRRVAVGEQVEVVSMTGHVALNDGAPKVHAHVVVAKADGSAYGGHLMEARVDPTLELVVTESPAYLRRATDARTGLPLLSL